MYKIGCILGKRLVLRALVAMAIASVSFTALAASPETTSFSARDSALSASTGDFSGIPEKAEQDSFYKQQYILSETRIFVEDMLNKWENERLLPALREQQAFHKTEIEVLNKRAEMVLDNSTFILGAVTLFATVFGVLIAIFGMRMGKDISTLQAETKEKTTAVAKEAQQATKEATALLQRATTQTDTSIGATAWNSWAAQLVRQADTATGVERARLWKEASKYYQNATDLDASYAGAWSNWANLLIEQASAAKGDGKAALWKKADEYYHKATVLDPSFAPAWNNWANLFVAQAEITDADKREALWEKARAYYKKVTELNPSNAEVWDNWANLVVKQGDLATTPKDKAALWQQADTYYKKTTEMDELFGGAWVHWANLLTKQATIANDDEKKRLLDQATEYRQKATELDPSLHDDTAPPEKSTTL